MCHNNNSTSPPNHNKHVSLQTLSSTVMIKQERREEEKEEDEDIKPTRASLRPKRAAISSRKSTRRRKKPKYLSLRSARLSAPNDAVRSSSSAGVPSASRRGQQLNLFPVKPEQSESEYDGGNVAMLFESDGGDTLTGLLTAAYTAPATTASTVSSDQDYCEEESEKFPNYPYQGLKYSEAEQNDIVRTAMRRPSRDLSGEKWICYSELVEKKEEIEFPTSSASTCCSIGDHADQRDRWVATAPPPPPPPPPSLALKLDYEEILNAWSDKGSLFVHGEPPQTVPDLLHDSNFYIDDLWRVPGEFENGYLKRKIREASVLRYKEKRKKRLYSKQIRYEVRKINAEKRPRMRGRFVKKD